MENKSKHAIEIFNKESSEYGYSRYAGMNSTSHSFIWRRKRVFEMIGDKKGRVLDIGCGPGVMVEGFNEEGYEFFGIDAAQGMIDECKRKYGEIKNAHFSTGKIEKINFPDNHFDIIVCMGVVEYIQNNMIALREIYRVLKPGGIAVITLPNVKCPYRIWNRLVIKNLGVIKEALGKKRHSLEHHEYREEDYVGDMKTVGFEVPVVFYYNFQLLFFPLDKIVPFITVPISRFFERFYKGRLRWLGTGFIVKGIKK